MTPDEANDAARRILIALCGGRWTSPPVRMIDEYPVPAHGTIILSGRPVREVYSVTGPGGNPVPYTIRNGYVLRVATDGTARAECGPARAVRVDYTYGQAELPAVLTSAISVLAEEMLLASSSAQCRIPERVTNVTRQGVSWTLLDPQDFLSEGRTGIYEVDLAVRALNPSGAKRRARLFSLNTSAPALRSVAP